MAFVFALGMLAYYLLVLWRRRQGRDLAKLLWVLYFALGVGHDHCRGRCAESGLRRQLPSDALLLCVLISVSGFLGSVSRRIGPAILSIRGQGLIEGVLILLQLYAAGFFLPFAIDSLVGDTNENRLELAGRF